MFDLGSYWPASDNFAGVYWKLACSQFLVLKLGMKHRAIDFYKVCINHDPGMTVTFLRQGQLMSPMLLNWIEGKMLFICRNLARNEQMDRRFMFMKIFWAKGVVCPAPGLYIYVYDHNIQTLSSQKPLGQSRQNYMWIILRKREWKFV